MNDKNLKDNLLCTIFAIFFCVSLLIFSTKITIMFKPIYYVDIKALNLSSKTFLSENEIKSVYDYLINFLTSSDISTFSIPYLHSSNNGIVHFYEVKSLLKGLDYLFYLSVTLCYIAVIFNLIKIHSLFFKEMFLIFGTIISYLIISFSINFDSAFTVFHEMVFKNDYWLLDPKTDPVINILPEMFFLHCAIFMLIILIASSSLVIFLYNKKAAKI